MPDASPPPRRRRRWRVFSLQALMGLILVLGVGLGWWVNSARDQALALATIRAFDRNASVTYDKQPPGISRLIPVVSWREAVERLWPPAWLERSLGENYGKKIESLVYGGLVPPDADPERARHALAAIPRLSGLKSLTIYARVTDADIDLLADLPALVFLRLKGDGSGLTDVGCRSLTRLTTLRHLEIDNAPITDAGLVALGKIPTLISLSLSGRNADASEPPLIAVNGSGFAAMGQLQILELRSSALSGATLRHLGRLENLHTLWFAGNAITDDDLAPLASLKGLVNLEIHGARFRGVGLRHLNGLTRLSRLTIHNAPINDQGAVELARLPALRTVDLRWTHLTAAGLQVLQSAPLITGLMVKPDPPGFRPLPDRKATPPSPPSRWTIAPIRSQPNPPAELAP